MQYDFDQLINRADSDCVKWNYFQREVLPLWVADMDFHSPDSIIEALHARVEHGVFGYVDAHDPAAECNRELTTAILNWLEEKYRWVVQPEDIVFIPGVVMGFNLACHTTAQPGGGVLIQTPVYFPFLSAPAYAGQTRQEMQLAQGADNSYLVDLDAFDAAITPETNLFILCNPHNPVGRVYRRDELLGMAEACLRHDVIICSDEIHADLIYPGHQHIPIASLDDEIAQKTITLLAPSKTFNIPGLNASFAVIQNSQLRRQYLHSAHGLLGSVNLLGLTAMQAAYQKGGQWLEQLLAYLKNNRDFVYEFVCQEFPGVDMNLPEGTYLAWIDFRGTGLQNPQQFFLQEARVGLSDGKIFGNGGEGFIRMNFGCPRQTLEKALSRMAEAYSSQL